MKALIVCPTYGRLPYLGRLLASFLNQDYDDKHLVIINDDKKITLECDYDNVTVMNLTRKISVGEKRNLGAAYGHFDVIHPWDDDDIFLPNRLSNHMKQYADPSVEAYRNFSSYTIYADKFSPCNGGTNNKSYRKKMFFDVGGYESTNNFGEDLELHHKLKNFKKDENENERDFVYGFSTSNFHLSCQPTELQIQNISYEQLLELNLLNKKFIITPDYDEYNKYLLLDQMFKNKGESIDIDVLPNGKIKIPNVDNG
jgi:glycosyltransferase involved in cell wall biosynthesis